MCYVKTKELGKKVFMLAQFKLFDLDDNLVYTGGENRQKYSVWKETDIAENETFIGLRCAIFEDLSEVMGLGVVTVCNSPGKKS